MQRVLEIEKKYELTQPVESFVATIKSAGFNQINVEHEADTYYSRPDVDYMKTVECLRIRKRDDYAELTYKPPTVHQTDVIAKQETNVRLLTSAGADDARVLFDSMGMVELVTVSKTRQSFQRPDDASLTVCIDRVEHAGVFVEIEVISNDLSRANNQISAAEEELDLDQAPAVHQPYRDLVLKFSEQKNG